MDRSTAAAPQPIFQIRGYLPTRLGSLGSRLTRRIAQSCKGIKLSAPEWRVVMAIGQSGGTKSQDVTMRTAMPKVRVSRAVAGLLKVGLITREADPQDRRYAILDLTKGGRDIYDQIVLEAQDFEAEIMAALTPRERAALDRVLAKIEAHMTQADTSAGQAEAADRGSARKSVQRRSEQPDLRPARNALRRPVSIRVAKRQEAEQRA